MNFFKTVLASCLGVVLASFLVVFLGSMVIGSLVASGDSAKKVAANSILEINFGKPIPEKTNNVATDPLSFETESVLGLHDMVAAIEHAKENDKIKGIYLDLSAAPGGRATSSVLRDALVDFKESGKFILAYSIAYSQGTYYMASVADEVLMHPLGGVDFLGFSAQIPFFKDMLDRLGIKMQVYYAGQFKSATEPFRRNEMSDQNRLQTRQYLEGMYQIYLDDISESRGIPANELRAIADGYKLRKAEDALTYKFVDALVYHDQVRSNLKDRIGLDVDDKLEMIGLGDYQKGNKNKIDFKIKDKIAVVYAEGDLVDGKGEEGNIGGDKYAKIIRKIREDKKVKAIVLRVNSPGGSVVASDLIWRELILAKEAGTPIVVSMGDLAASGGYYISCMADSIFAEPNTITGSIGVFGMIPNIQTMLDEKAGITFDSVKTGPYSHGISPFFAITKEEGKVIQTSIDDIYDLFLTKVAEGRGMTKGAVHEVAQGRVWTGEKALEIGLVDAMGGMDEALAAAAEKANLESYRVSEYPKVKEPIEALIEKLTGQDKKAKAMLTEEVKAVFPEYKYLEKIRSMKGPQARLPFVVEDF